MKLFTRLILGLILLAAFMPAAAVHAAPTASPQQQAAQINCEAFAIPGSPVYIPGSSAVSGTAPSGAQTCVIMPTAGWNGGLVIFAHGYVFAYPPDKPVSIPWEQMVLADPSTGVMTGSIPQMILSQGFAFATTSYSKNGLAVLEGVSGVLELVDVFKAAVAAQLPPGAALPNIPVFLIGASEGGLVTTLAVENYPKVFMGGVAACGPVGDFQQQINYWGDFRAAYDYYFPANGLGGDAVHIPDTTMAGWYAGTLVNYNAMLLQQYPVNLQTLLAVTGAPVDPSSPLSPFQTTLGILDYNVMATNEAIVELGGQPYSNIDTVYADPALNLAVTRYTADKAALKTIKKDYQTKGLLKRPLVILHTTADPIVPYWHATLYNQKVIQHDSAPYLYLMPVERYGHCAFSAAEELQAFGTLLQMVQQQAAVQ